MSPAEPHWTTEHDRALRDALISVDDEAGSLPLPDPESVRARGDRARRRHKAAWTAAAAAVLVAVAGIGFTVALFFATAAFLPGPVLDEVKMGSLLSFLAAPCAILLGRAVGLRGADRRGGPPTPPRAAGSRAPCTCTWRSGMPVAEASSTSVDSSPSGASITTTGRSIPARATARNATSRASDPAAPPDTRT